MFHVELETLNRNLQMNHTSTWNIMTLQVFTNQGVRRRQPSTNGSTIVQNETPSICLPNKLWIPAVLLVCADHLHHRHRHKECPVHDDDFYKDGMLLVA